jgi:acylphosphatase
LKLDDNLVRVCLLLRKNNVNFVVIGARACALHGYVRATEDIDILIQQEKNNLEKVIQAIKELYPHMEEEITPEDFYSSIVIKILDEPELDLTISAWSLTFEDAQKDICKIILDDVEIPYLGLESLIKSKETEREQDIWDVKVLKEIRNKKK